MDDKDIKELHKILNKSNPNLNELTSILNDNADSEPTRTTRRMRGEDEQQQQQQRVMEIRRTLDQDNPFFNKPVLHRPVIYKPYSFQPVQGATVLHPPLTLLPAAAPPPPPPPPQPLTLSLSSSQDANPVYYMQTERPVHFIKENQPEPLMVKEESYYVKDSDYQQLNQVVARGDQPVYIQGKTTTTNSLPLLFMARGSNSHSFLGDNLLVKPAPPPPPFLAFLSPRQMQQQVQPDFKPYFIKEQPLTVKETQPIYINEQPYYIKEEQHQQQPYVIREQPYIIKEQPYVIKEHIVYIKDAPQPAPQPPPPVQTIIIKDQSSQSGQQHHQQHQGSSNSPSIIYVTTNNPNPNNKKPIVIQSLKSRPMGKNGTIEAIELKKAPTLVLDNKDLHNGNVTNRAGGGGGGIGKKQSLQPQPEPIKLIKLKPIMDSKQYSYNK